MAAKKTSSAKSTATRKPAPAATKPAPAKKVPVTKVPAKKKAAEPKKAAPARKTAPANRAAPGKQVVPATKAAPVKKAAAPGKKVAPATKAAPAEKAAMPAKKVGPATKPAPEKKAVAKAPAAPRKPSLTSMTPSLLSNAQFERFEIPPPRGRSKDGIAYTKDFDVKFLKVQRDELLARRKSELARAMRLEDEATSIIEDGEMGDVQFDDEGGEGDTMVVQRDLDRVISTQARQTILDIDAALVRIEQGIYGYSAISGMPIPRERLEAIPETTVLAAEKVSGVGPR